ncbi:MAG: hypothetical protein KDJ33_18895 [Gammaproteobacteria bacterium]|nr:hypothetical protein [Gammaproteobacteria bacterium]
MPLLTKPVASKRLLDMDFKRWCRDGDTIESVLNVAVENLQTIEGSSDITLGSHSFSGIRAQVWIPAGGTAGERYRVTVTCRMTPSGEELPGDGIVVLRG